MLNRRSTLTVVGVAAFAAVIFHLSSNDIPARCTLAPRSFYYSSRVGAPLLISSLPGRVVAPEGELTLYADYGDHAEESLTLYLVNRTDKRIAFPSQDSDIYVKLEALTERTEWERAQTHLSSGCGNSYFATPGLRPGEYFRFSGYYPSDGEPRTVRYRVYGDHAFILDEDTPEENITWIKKDLEKFPLNLVSNAGLGSVRPSDIDAAHRDVFAVPHGSFKTVRDLALGMIEGPHAGRGRDNAVAALGRFPSDASLALIEGFIADPDRSISYAAMRALAQIGTEFEAAEQLYQEHLRSEDAFLRAMAIRSLRERPVTADVIEFARQRLHDDDLMVRHMAMGVIAHRCQEEPEMKAFINSIYDDADPKIQSIFETVLFPTCINYQERGYKGRFQRPGTAGH